MSKFSIEKFPKDLFLRQFTSLKDLKNMFRTNINTILGIDPIAFIDYGSKFFDANGLLTMVGCRHISNRSLFDSKKHNYIMNWMLVKTEFSYVSYVSTGELWLRYEDEVCTKIPDYKSLVKLIMSSGEIPIVIGFKTGLSAEISDEGKFEEEIFNMAMKNMPPFDEKEWVCESCHSINQMPQYSCRSEFSY